MPIPGSAADRGYGREHEALRAKLKPDVEAGRTTCWRCGNPIWPGQRWDLGHDDNDRTIYRGPEHVRCNRRAGAIRGNRMRGRRKHMIRITRLTGPIDYTDPDW